ncbi:MAG: glycerol-3-phosphate 1-O-acyltransferase PlsY [Clostridia bacterium]|nr:glycerol-3-phosphate 1-O-acyltransferase PlsY [Clostridia bacterium]
MIKGIFWSLFEGELGKTAFFASGGAYAVAIILCMIVGYLLGSVNSAIVVSKLKYKQDVRNYGSKNAGMTNMFRVYGKTGGLLTLAGDFAKTLLAVLFAEILVGNGKFFIGSEGAYVAGFFCMLGHIFPLYYKFKGGKGVLVTATTLLLVEPVVFAALFVIFAVIFLGSKMVSLASVMCALLLPVLVDSYYKVLIGQGGAAGAIRMIIIFLTAGIVVFMHRANIKRIYNGEESKMELFKKKKLPESSDEIEEAVEEKPRGEKVDKNTSRKKLRNKK